MDTRRDPAATSAAALRTEQSSRVEVAAPSPNQPESLAGALLAPPEQVLSTLNRDGSRRWLYPRLSPGRFLVARRIVAYALIALFALIPHIHLNGKPLIFLNLAQRQFTILGVTFLPTDTVLLALFMLSVFVTIFLFTAVLGRVWCGWACPQTVYLEFLYRPLERLFSGTSGRGGVSSKPRNGGKTVALYACYVLASLFLAHTFLAYFVGAEALEQWVRRSPLEHPGSFIVMAVTTALMMFNFCYFREQTCVLACPYGRFQSVLLDRHSLIISYDECRGEPRGKLRRAEAGGEQQAGRGDCIDCNLCVVTCPTGIDIRKGLQMECVGCAQCIDACDAIMDKIHKPRGLIRYTSEAGLRNGRPRIVRGRVIVYAVALLIASSALTTLLVTWPTANVQVLRGLGRPFSKLPDGSVANPVRLKMTNRGEQPAAYTVTLEGAEGADLRLQENPISVSAGQTITTNALIVRPAETVKPSAQCVIRVRDGAKFEKSISYTLLGPAAAEDAHGSP